MEKKILQFIEKNLENGKKTALILLTETSGSTPGKPGCIMGVCEDESKCGTVGGGALEHDIYLSAMEALRVGEDRTFAHTLTQQGDLGMLCGGNASGYIKVFSPKKKLLILGAGHIGQALYEIATTLDFEITVMDDRPEYANVELFPKADHIIVGPYEEGLARLKTDTSTYIVVVTRGHEHDTLALKHLLNKNYAYIGMIGSQRKVKHTLEILGNMDAYKDSIGRLHSPIGLDIGSNLPKEIALSILTEIILIKNGKRTPRFMQDVYREKEGCQ